MEPIATDLSMNVGSTGLEVNDIDADCTFARRTPHPRDPTRQLAGLARLGRAFVETPATMLQELVQTAVDLCGADSAGVSVERENGTDLEFYHWVATAGSYSDFLNAILPRQPSACGICLRRGRPQHFRVNRRFFEILGVEAPLVTDGILLPWQVDDTRGTIFVMAHTRDEAFDLDDVRTMQMLADFAAMGHRQLQQQARLIQQERNAAAAALANHLAHRINNPLQGMTNRVYLAMGSGACPEVKALASQLDTDLRNLSGLIGELLALPLA